VRLAGEKDRVDRCGGKPVRETGGGKPVRKTSWTACRGQRWRQAGQKDRVDRVGGKPARKSSGGKPARKAAAASRQTDSDRGGGKRGPLLRQAGEKDHVDRCGLDRELVNARFIWDVGTEHFEHHLCLPRHASSMHHSPCTGYDFIFAGLFVVYGFYIR
jgi:hypothetical protein